jgi:diguanylate cyclase (GGDEF)-like protein
MTAAPLRILYIEDELDIRQVATFALETVGGFVVEACSSGEQALRTLAQFKPDLILLDVMMPGMDGPTTLQKLRALPESDGVPAVFMTAKVQPREIAELKSIGALEVIPKPFDPMTLSQTISDIWTTNARRSAPAEPPAQPVSSSQRAESLVQIADAFAAALPGRVAEIGQMVDALGSASVETRQVLHRSVHSLAGSAKTFGFPLVSDAARALELGVEPLAGEDARAVEPRLPEIRRLLQALLHSAQQPREAMPLPVEPVPHARTGEVARVVYTMRDPDGWIDGVRPSLEGAGYEVGIFADLEQLIHACETRMPAAVLAEVPAAGRDAALTRWTDVLRKRLSQPPSLIFVADVDDVQTRLRAVQAGGIAYFVRPLKLSALVDRLDELSGRGTREPYRVMIVEDAEEQAALCSTILTRSGMLTCIVGDPNQIVHQLADFHPELVLMDMYLPGCTGDDLARLIRQIDAYVSLPIVFLSVEADFERQLTAMGLGGDEFLTKPITPAQLISVVSSRVERYRTLRALMVQDSLTGLANHSRLHQLLETDVARALRQKLPLSLAMIDVDHFKQVNDRHGHPTGDRVLQALARFLRQRLRQSDVVARYGGEEFAVVLANTDGAGAQLVIDRLRAQFALLMHESDKGEPFAITFSAGIAVLEGHRTAREIILAADRALYQAKGAGRNCVVVSA